MALMTARGLCKSYPGKKALNGVDLDIEPGKITGLLGPNTAGKTTLLKTLAGLLHADAGEISYPDGASGAAARALVSFMPDSLELPNWMRVGDAFAFYAEAYPDYSAERMSELCGILSLDTERRVNKLSKGMKERLSLALAFSRRSKVYLLDEPLGGIDPVGKMKVLETILSMPLGDSAILLSTHLIKDVETIFDRVSFLSHGEIIFSGDCERLREEQGKNVEQMYLEVFGNVEPD